MLRTYAIALNTFREAIRDRVLYGVLGFSVFNLLFSLALGELSLGEQRRVVADLGYASISLFSVVIAIFLGSSLLYKEIERKTLYVILPKPIARAEFLVGKYLGIALTASVFVALMGAVQLWVMAVQRGSMTLALGLGPVLAAGLAGVLVWRAKDRTAALLPVALGLLAAGAAHGQAGAHFLGRAVRRAVRAQARAVQGVHADQFSALLGAAQTQQAHAVGQHLQRQGAALPRARAGVGDLALADPAVAITQGGLEQIRPRLAAGARGAHSSCSRASRSRAHATIASGRSSIQSSLLGRDACDSAVRATVAFLP
jgi:hypothetical protein